MKNIVLSILTLSCCFLSAQTPEGFNYQAVARDSTGAILANKPVSIKFSILTGSISGSSVYSESHSLSTNQYGLFTAVVGKGGTLSGTFSGIQWGNDAHFLKIELDAGSGSYQHVGTTQLISVPYALHAKEAEKVAEKGSNAKTLLFLSH